MITTPGEPGSGTPPEQDPLAPIEPPAADEAPVDSDGAGEIEESPESLWESAPIEEPAIEEPVAGEPAVEEPADQAEPGESTEATEAAEAEVASEESGVDAAEPGERAEGDAKDDRTAEPVSPAASDLPDLTTDRALHSALESLLLVVDEPADEEHLAAALDQPAERVTEALRTMATLYTEDGRGIDLRRVGDGWRFYTRDRYAPYVEKLILGGQRAKLTRAALESLAVIAYRQPVTRARVAAVRGVNVDGVVRTLLARGLIEEVGTDSDTGGILYRTTELFLERLGLSSLEDLPPIAPLLPEVDAVEDI